jgi:hypothetical protein
MYQESDEHRAVSWSMTPIRNAGNRLRTRIGHTEVVHHLCKTPWPSTRLVCRRELRPVRVGGIPHTAVAVPRKAPRMPSSERTAQHDAERV